MNSTQTTISIIGITIATLLVCCVSSAESKARAAAADKPAATTAMHETDTNHCSTTCSDAEFIKAGGAVFSLSKSEFDLITETVMAEAGGEPYKGQMAVAQCILDTCRREQIRPKAAIENFGYTTNRKTPTESVKNAVMAVFTYGETVTDENIMFFYNPDTIRSDWHESQQYVCTIGHHRFFALNEEVAK